MDVIAAYRQVGSHRGAVAVCGTTHKTVKPIVQAADAASAGDQQVADRRPDRGHAYGDVEDWS